LGGWRFWRVNQPLVDEKEDLSAEKSWLKQQIDAINERLAEIEDK